jgi:hypothetical protein
MQPIFPLGSVPARAADSVASAGNVCRTWSSIQQQRIYFPTDDEPKSAIGLPEPTAPPSEEGCCSSLAVRPGRGTGRAG